MYRTNEWWGFPWWYWVIMAAVLVFTIVNILAV
jgi:hypothetical protein